MPLFYPFEGEILGFHGSLHRCFIQLSGQGVVKIRYTVDGKEYASHYLYGGPSQKYVGEKKIKFSDYRRWMGL